MQRWNPGPRATRLIWNLEWKGSANFEHFLDASFEFEICSEERWAKHRTSANLVADCCLLPNFCPLQGMRRQRADQVVWWREREDCEIVNAWEYRCWGGDYHHPTLYLHPVKIIDELSL